MTVLKGRTAVVTGAAGGIGAAVALRLAEAGCNLAISDINTDGLEKTAEGVRNLGCNVSTHKVDVSNREEMEKFVADVDQEHRGAHILVNNAGVSVAKTFEEHTLEDFEWLMGINFWGVVYGCKLFLPLLKSAGQAHIVNISSLFGLIGVPMNTSYCASKFAVKGLSDAMRPELEGYGIKVTSVHPGGVATNIVNSARWDEKSDEVRDETVRRFTTLMPPKEAARQIVKGIQSDTPRVLVTRETYIADAALRVSPGLARTLISKYWKKVQQKRQ